MYTRYCMSQVDFMNPVEIRPMNRGDFKAVQEIVRKTWDFDKMADRPREALYMSAVYLSSCIGQSRYCRVACIDGQIAGVIMGRCGQAPLLMPKEYWGIFLTALAGAACSRRCRRLARLFGGFSKDNEALLKNCRQRFDGEICLFAVDEVFRGRGIGVQLFEDMKEYLKKQHAKSFYLFTDTSCTYEFYDCHGMLRLGEKKVNMRPHLNKDMYLYIYGAAL